MKLNPGWSLVAVALAGSCVPAYALSSSRQITAGCGASYSIGEGTPTPDIVNLSCVERVRDVLPANAPNAADEIGAGAGRARDGDGKEYVYFNQPGALAGYALRGDPGDLGARVSVSVQGARSGNTLVGSAFGSSRLEYRATDQFVVRSDSLPDGTQIRLSFDGVFEGALAHASSKPNLSVFQYWSGVSIAEPGASRSLGGGFFCATSEPTSACYTPDWAPTQPGTGGNGTGFATFESPWQRLIDWYVGVPLEITHTLSLSAATGFASVYGEPLASGSTFTNVDSWNSSKFNIRLSTPTGEAGDFYLVSATGHDYAASPVPEPASLVLAAAGLGVLLSLRWRRPH